MLAHRPRRATAAISGCRHAGRRVARAGGRRARRPSPVVARGRAGSPARQREPGGGPSSVAAGHSRPGIRELDLHHRVACPLKPRGLSTRGAARLWPRESPARQAPGGGDRSRAGRNDSCLAIRDHNVRQASQSLSTVARRPLMRARRSGDVRGGASIEHYLHAASAPRATTWCAPSGSSSAARPRTASGRSGRSWRSCWAWRRPPTTAREGLSRRRRIDSDRVAASSTSNVQPRVCSATHARRPRGRLLAPLIPALGGAIADDGTGGGHRRAGQVRRDERLVRARAMAQAGPSTLETGARTVADRRR